MMSFYDETKPTGPFCSHFRPALALVDLVSHETNGKQDETWPLMYIHTYIHAYNTTPE